MEFRWYRGTDHLRRFVELLTAPLLVLVCLCTYYTLWRLPETRGKSMNYSNITPLNCYRFNCMHCALLFKWKSGVCLQFK